MSERPVVPVATREAQRRAADPRASAWVSANAGAGKTYVLSRRVVRLLLDDVAPARILALTFTKAAAANMATRVFEILGKWVTLTDDELAAEITEIEGAAPDALRLERARKLFARAVETPGGLKIQTIHAFCERLLHLFPFEANVSAAFEVLDDAGCDELLAQARHDLLHQATLHPGTREARALETVEQAAGEAGFATVLRAALGFREQLRAIGTSEDGLQRYRHALCDSLGVGQAETAAGIAAAIVHDGIPPGEWAALAETLAADGKKTEQGHADALREAFETLADEDKAAAYARVYLTDKDQPRADTYLTKGFRTAHPALSERMDTERARVHSLVERRKAVEAIDRSVALVTLAGSVVMRYETAKGARGALDFDDLVARTARLLARSDAAWVLYKLDQGIDHILVDEAQDTSEAQWDILKRLTAEFVAGRRSDRQRTIFAVGDSKQSIFSFQGADPKAFEDARRFFSDAYATLKRAEPEAGWVFNDETLTLSFRSAGAVLEGVDKVFALDAHYRGLAFGDTAVGTVHETARPHAPGLVDLWPATEPAPARDEDAWARPLDEPDEASPAVRLARRIAEAIDRWRGAGDAFGHRIPPGDVLILVRSRNAFFEAMIRALKQRRVPVAGADRLALTTHIAVMDLLALGRSCLLPDDDLTLATVLKSPLVGLGEDELFDLASGRSGSLAYALVKKADESDRWRRVQERMDRWRSAARATGPFTFYARVLGPDGGRKALLGRLGSEAGDAVDEFLRIALDHEQHNAPSLSAFLDAMADADLVVKRDMEAGRDEVRVMTVHGAKGLEAPVVFLADTCSVPRNDAPLLVLPGTGLPVWLRGKTRDPEALRKLREREEDRIREEYHRLLYVAMTRAKDRLIIAGFVGSKGRGKSCWYDMVETGLRDHLAEVPDERGDGTMIRRLMPLPFAPAQATPPPAEPPEETLPSWLETPAAPEAEAGAPLRPSSALSAAEAPDRTADTPFVRDARAAGTLAHLLLEVLPGCPAERRRAVAMAMAQARGGALAPARREAVAQAVLTLIEDPQLAALFGPGSRAEAPLAGRLRRSDGSAVPVSGQIDRLAVTPDAVFIADYKTTARPPKGPEAIPESHVAQLAVYRALVGPLYPGRPVRCLVVWTATAAVMEVPPSRLDAALARITAA